MVVQVCKACHSAELEKPKDGHPSYLLCPSCRAIQLTYKPLPHQDAFHRDNSKHRAFFGGYGSGKTRTTDQEVLMLLLENPGTTGLVTAATYPQLRETTFATFFKDVCPPVLIKDHHKQENKTTLINGSELLWRSADDEGKMRSLNLGFFKIEEASEVNYEIFVQLQSRLRNDRMKYHRGLIASNPDLNWIKGEFLLKSHKITGGDVDYTLHLAETNPGFSSHIAPTHLNIHLPKDFIPDLVRSKPEWWINRFLKGSFEHTDGAVYPNFSKTVIEPFEIPKHWQMIRIGHDHGLRNPTATVFAAINPHKTMNDFRLPRVVVYDLHYEAGQLVPHHAAKIKEKMKDIPFGASVVMKIDPSTRNKDPITGRSVQGYYQELGLFFQPANNSLDMGLAKVNTYIETGALKIFNTLKPLIEEGLNYKYPEQDMHEEKNPEEKPKKVKDHAMDALRYLIVDLPDDPNRLFTTSGSAPNGKKVRTATKDGQLLVDYVDDEDDEDDEYSDTQGKDWRSYA